MEPDDRVVSSDDELLILVDGDDRQIGFLAKADAHLGRGTLHRAFSLFVFNPAGELLVQQRAEGKRLWPGYWSNTCCSHPRHREAMDSAVRRRLKEELGLNADLEFLFKFQYRAQYDAQGAEHELCWVYAGRSAEVPRANVHEVAACATSRRRHCKPRSHARLRPSHRGSSSHGRASRSPMHRCWVRRVRGSTRSSSAVSSVSCHPG